MTKRWLRILLGTLVVGIWGAVIVRALHRPSSVEPSMPTPTILDRTTAPLDTASIPLFVHDPFLDGPAPPPTERSTHTRTPAAPRPVPGPAPLPAPARAWPKVTYKGTLRAKGDPATTVAFLAVEGRDLLIKQGQESQGFTVVRMSPDSLVLRWSGEERPFARK